VDRKAFTREQEQQLSAIISWLRGLPNAQKAKCVETVLYLEKPDFKYQLGQRYAPGDTLPRAIQEGRALKIADLSGLPPRKVARFIKGRRSRLAKLASMLREGETPASRALARTILQEASIYRENQKRKNRAG